MCLEKEVLVRWYGVLIIRLVFLWLLKLFVIRKGFISKFWLRLIFYRNFVNGWVFFLGICVWCLSFNMICRILKINIVWLILCIVFIFEDIFVFLLNYWIWIFMNLLNWMFFGVFYWSWFVDLLSRCWVCLIY